MALLMAVANIIQHFAIREWFHRLVVSHTAIVNVAPSPLPRLSPFSIHVYIFSSNISFSCVERNKKKERTIPVYTAIASHVTKAKKGSERGRETLSERFVERGVSNYSMSIATTIHRWLKGQKSTANFPSWWDVASIETYPGGLICLRLLIETWQCSLRHGVITQSRPRGQPPSLPSPPLLCLRDVLGYHDLCVTQLLLFREQSAGIRAQGSRRFAWIYPLHCPFMLRVSSRKKKRKKGASRLFSGWAWLFVVRVKNWGIGVTIGKLGEKGWSE